MGTGARRLPESGRPQPVTASQPPPDSNVRHGSEVLTLEQRFRKHLERKSVIIEHGTIAGSGL